ncbi:hypothetical protein QCN27_13955 [Cereibacter sp. SYSU M97828]|nr:hypothetical protein [Cereibacter flavus]
MKPLPFELVSEIADFIMANLDRHSDGTYGHSFVSAQETACELLEALGYVERTEWGAVPLSSPRLPATLPRHDDTCVVVLALADQQGLISFLADRDDPTKNIGPNATFGAARADDELIPLLNRLGIISKEGAWMPGTEPILWRCWPYEWPTLDFSMNPIVTAAVTEACLVQPSAISAMLADANQHSEHVISDFYGQWVVVRHWRIEEGWLPCPDPPTIGIFHDAVSFEVWRAIKAKM